MHSHYAHGNLPPSEPIIEQTSHDTLPGRTVLSELICYYPEQIYVSSVLPTRTPRELQEFQTHCQYLLTAAGGREIVYTHPLREVLNISTSALNFQNLLWKSRTTVTSAGIEEEYQWIRRRIRQDTVDRPILEPAYNISYPWNDDGWTVSRPPLRIPPRRA